MGPVAQNGQNSRERFLQCESGIKQQKRDKEDNEGKKGNQHLLIMTDELENPTFEKLRIIISIFPKEKARKCEFKYLEVCCGNLTVTVTVRSHT